MTTVVVSVGTHEQPFQRFLDAMTDIIESRPDVTWVVQYGTGQWLEREGVRAAPYFASGEMQQLVADADVLVSQCSPGTIFGALEARTWPVVVGRRKRYDEHVDDHQVRFAQIATEMGLASGAPDVAGLAATLTRVLDEAPEAWRARCDAALEGSAARTEAFRREFWVAVDRMLDA